MKKIKNSKNSIRLNRKGGLVDKFITLVIVLVGLFLIFGGLFLLMNAKMKENKQVFNYDVNSKDGLYTTRMLLNEEIRDGYKVYDAVIAKANGGDTEQFQKDISSAIVKFYPDGKVYETWRIIVNNECFFFSEGTTQQVSGKDVVITPSPTPTTPLPMLTVVKYCDSNEINLMPKVTVPNPDGKNILVMFKPSKPADKIRGRIFGSRADETKGILEEDIPTFSLDGRELVRIENIPQITCDESATVVGKICAADALLVRQLKELSANELQPKGMRLQINQAYRTYDIQKRLFIMNCASGTCSPPTCDPDTAYMCPHMQSGAIDINIITADGKNLNEINPQAVEDIMCKYGFVRWHEERWHFEYNTNKWKEIQKKYEGREKPCSY
jgi:hypothetical protein